MLATIDFHKNKWVYVNKSLNIILYLHDDFEACIVDLVVPSPSSPNYHGLSPHSRNHIDSKLCPSPITNSKTQKLNKSFIFLLVNYQYLVSRGINCQSISLKINTS